MLQYRLLDTLLEVLEAGEGDPEVLVCVLLLLLFTLYTETGLHIS